ncbi:hypothetical protein L7F22_005184 [Adiantum nelumboides]|nr:hypothetical protein [Adiantum nelumboides]
MRAILQREIGAIPQRSGFWKAYSSRVMSFGDGSQGALGQSQGVGSVTSDAYEPLPVDVLPNNVIRVATGHYHSLAVTADGQLWSWGRNNEGQLGRGMALSRKQCDHPQIVKGLENVEWRPQLVPLGDLKQLKFLVDSITEGGIRLSFGDNSYGQLGRKQGTVVSVEGWRVELDNCVSCIGSGLGHSLAVCSDHRQGKTENIKRSGTHSVHSWGWNAAFQLERGTNNERPMQVEGLEQCQVPSVDGGRVHSAAVDSEGGL